MNRRNERQKGFTLIELLVVLIILAVLATVLVPALTSYVDDAREKKAVSEAQVCVTAATEWAAVQRTALIAQAYQSNKSFADAYKAAADTAKWSTDYDALNTAAPTVTGTLALAEGDGQYFLRPEPAPTNDTTDAAMKTTVQTAAGVDGTLQKLQLNADGKVLYLLYTSAEGIPVAYTAAGTAQNPATTVPVATLPEDTTLPEPTEPVHSGDLVFCVLDEYTGLPVEGITFRMDAKNDHSYTEQTTDADGKVYYPIDISKLDWGNNIWILTPIDWPAGYQKVYPVQFRVYPDNQRTDFIFNIDNNLNRAQGQYMDGFTGNQEGIADNHVYTFYVRTVPTLELCVWDDGNGNYLNGVEFTLSNGTKSTTITSGSSTTLLDVNIHDDDKPLPERKVIDISQSMYSSDWLVKFASVPDGYQYFDNCILRIGVTNLNQRNHQLYATFPTGQYVENINPRTKIVCKDLPDQNKCIVTIHVKAVNR